MHLDFWNELVRAKLSLIIDDECGNSNVTLEEANRFMYEDGVDEREEAVMDVEDDMEDDLLDMLE
jgi:hypothetical protein